MLWELEKDSFIRDVLFACFVFIIFVFCMHTSVCLHRRPEEGVGYRSLQFCLVL